MTFIFMIYQSIKSLFQTSSIKVSLTKVYGKLHFFLRGKNMVTAMKKPEEKKEEG